MLQRRSRRNTLKAKQLVAKTNLSSETRRFFTSLITYIEEILDWYKKRKISCLSLPNKLKTPLIKLFSFNSFR